MYANGYVGTSEDAQRLRKLDKQREQQRKKFEELQEKKKNEAAGLRQFGSSKAEAYEAAFKTETVGLVTRKEFVERRATIQERLEEDELRERLQAEAAAAEEKERRRKEKEKKRAKAKLSFAADVSETPAGGAPGAHAWLSTYAQQDTVPFLLSGRGMLCLGPACMHAPGDGWPPVKEHAVTSVLLCCRCAVLPAPAGG